MRKAALSDVKDDLSRDYKLENDPRFLRRVESARRNLAAGKGIRLEDIGPSKPAKR